MKQSRFLLSRSPLHLRKEPQSHQAQVNQPKNACSVQEYHPKSEQTKMFEVMGIGNKCQTFQIYEIGNLQLYFGLLFHNGVKEIKQKYKPLIVLFES